MCKKLCIFVLKMQLYLFNPENDMALAYGGPYYMPPSNARRMAHDLAALPMWYASRGSDVWLAEARQVEWMDRHCPVSLGVRGVTSLSSIYNKVCPWGWSASVAYRLKERGVGAEACPSLLQIERIRELSARGMALDVLHTLGIPHLFGGAVRVEVASDVLSLVKKHGKMLLKAPWSGSGRGIQLVEGPLNASLQGWVNHIFKTQGYVVAEPFYDKVVDFAMEFLSAEGVVRFAGYSWFETDSRGIYKENLLAGDDEIESRLARYVGKAALQQVRNALEEKLTQVVNGAYQGYLGVDMMVCCVDGGYALHPCVEINLRMNMGITARLLYDCHVHPSAEGRFVIEYYPEEGEALRMHQAMQKAHPLEMQEGKIKRGYWSLTPVFQDTCYQAYGLIP